MKIALCAASDTIPNCTQSSWALLPTKARVLPWMEKLFAPSLLSISLWKAVNVVST
jgi:hypothetical protein